MNAIFTKDAPTKKRKKWSDGQITVDRATRRVRVTDAGGAQLYVGVVDQPTMQKIDDEEEVKLGNVLVMMQETVNNAQSVAITTIQRPTLAALSAASARAPILNSNRPLSSQFKPPMVRSIVGTTSTSSITSSNSADGNLHNDEASGITDDRPQPATTGPIVSSTIPRSSLHSLSARRSIPSLMKTNKATLHLYRLYDRVPRKCEVDVQFREPSSYAEQFQAALYEEISLSLVKPMSTYESKVSRALHLPTENSTSSSTSSSSSSSNSNPGKCPNIDTITERLRKGGIPFISNVEVIVSPPKTQKEKENAARYQQGEKGDKRKKQRIDDDDDDGTTASTNSYQDRPKLWMKCQNGQRGCPTTCEGTN